ncbi:MAG: TIR domain-containing protein [Microscillaceae bacterium]|jgi:hypothetical protein|nr:TIR domain-containing protein [Microscillaceae bacterium]
MPEFKDVFISYSTKDQAPKDELKTIFDKAQISYFLDEKSLQVGKDIENSLIDNLNNTLFTVLLVSRNSLFSTWVCLECIHRLRQEEFEKRISLLPVLIDMSVMDADFPIEMVENFKNKRAELEKLRSEAVENDLPTKVYNDEIERVDEIIPQIGDIIQKIKNGLSANFTDSNRKEKDLAKILDTIRARKNEVAQKNELQQKYDKQPLANQTNSRLRFYIGAGLGGFLLLIFLLFFIGSFDSEPSVEESNQESGTSTNSIKRKNPGKIDAESQDSVQVEGGANTLDANYRLDAGDSLISANGAYVLKVREDDGHLCIYKNTEEETFVWGTEVFGFKNASLVMQADGNLVVYDGDNTPKWSTNTTDHFDAKWGEEEFKPIKVVLEDDGTLSLYSATGKVVWTSSKSTSE